MKRLKLRLYKHRDLDLIMLKRDPRVDFKGFVKSTLSEFVRNGYCSRYEFLSSSESILIADEIIDVAFDDEFSDVIAWLESLRRGEGGNAVKSVIRSAIKYPGVCVYQKDATITRVESTTKKAPTSAGSADAGSVKETFTSTESPMPVQDRVSAAKDDGDDDLDDDEFSLFSMMSGQEF